MRQQYAIRDRLLRQLPEHGWRRVRRVRRYSAHFTRQLMEIWELESLWRPERVRARLVFWRHSASDAFARIEVQGLDDQGGSARQIVLGNNWRDQIPWILATLADVREQPRIQEVDLESDSPRVLDEITWAD